ncbi:MAG: M28 family peptidase [Gemmatimonadota bacterium]
MKRLLFVLIFCAAPPSAAQTIDTMDLRARTRVLASDLLEGRATGTRGEWLAGLYIASELMRMGAQPATGDDFFLPIPLKRAVIDDAATTITYSGTTYHSTRDFVWNTGGRGALHGFAGPLLYVGRVDSTTARRARETRGRVVVVNGAMGAAAGSFIPALIEAGAAGVVLLIADVPTFELYVRSRGPARYFVDAPVTDPIWQADLPVVIAGPTLVRAMVRNTAPAPFTLMGGELAASFEAELEDVRSANLAGVIRGSGPKLASEYVAYSAHYDHLGISTPNAGGDSIYNGFSDNAAGVAMLLALGDVFHRERPARSILLLFFTGEERGLLGSTYYAAKPAIPLAQMRALINLDAGAPPAPPVDWRIAGGTASPLGEIARQALAERNWQAQLGAASPNSDYWPFLARGVPAIFLIPGSTWENLTAEQQEQLQARWNRYHQAGDEWSAEFPFSGLQRYAEAALAIGRKVAHTKKPGS